MAVLRFQARWIELIRAGRKVQTLRAQSRLQAGDVVDAVCRYDRGPFARLEVLEVSRLPVAELDESDAQREGVESLEALREGLEALYPGIGVVSRVRFRALMSPTSRRATSASSAAPR